MSVLSKERLTDETLNNAISVYKTTVEFAEDIDDEDYSIALDKVTLSFLEELKQYRDLEEQGLLLKLPCKVGDTVYSIIETRNCSGYRCTLEITCDECKFNDISYVIYQRKFNPDKDLTEINKTVFLTQSEAEEKLRELEEK